jgi:hypothetical protein
MLEQLKNIKDKSIIALAVVGVASIILTVVSLVRTRRIQTEEMGRHVEEPENHD